MPPTQMGMSTFSEAEHPRDCGGKFAAKAQSEADVSLDAVEGLNDEAFDVLSRRLLEEAGIRPSNDEAIRKWKAESLDELADALDEAVKDWEQREPRVEPVERVVWNPAVGDYEVVGRAADNPIPADPDSDASDRPGAPLDIDEFKDHYGFDEHDAGLDGYTTTADGQHDDGLWQFDPDEVSAWRDWAVHRKAMKEHANRYRAMASQLRGDALVRPASDPVWPQSWRGDPYAAAAFDVQPETLDSPADVGMAAAVAVEGFGVDLKRRGSHDLDRIAAVTALLEEPFFVSDPGDPF